MDPKDKYMNPRTPPKPKPQLPRLRTSPQLHQHGFGSSGSSSSDHDFRGASQPAAFSNPPRFRLVPLRKQPARSVSPSPSRGLKTAFLNLTQPRLLHISSEDEHPRHSPKGGTARAPSSKSRSNESSRTTSPANSPADGLGIGRLPLRRPVVENNGHSPKPPLRERRASRSRDRSPLPAPLNLTPKVQNQGSSGMLRVPNLEPLREGLSQQNTPTPGTSEKPRTAIPIDHKSTPLDTEKRLPTLPNSPSSIMEEELRALNARNGLPSMEVLRSHFSDTTVDSSEFSIDSVVEKSSFPDWTSDTETTDTDMISPASMTSSSSFNPDPSHHFNGESFTDSHVGTSKQESAPTTPTLSDGRRMSETSAFTTSESSSLMEEKPSFSHTFRLPDCDFGLSTLVIDDCYDHIVESDPKRHAGMFNDLENLTSTTSVAMSDQTWRPSNTSSGKADTQEPTNHSSVSSYMTQSTMLKELMDELGYLGEMIQAEL